MAEIKQTLKILKSRYAEVSLIIGLYMLVLVSMALVMADLLAQDKPLAAPPQNALLLFFSIAVALVSMILKYGFTRTVYLHSSSQQQPLVLLKTGMHFFWRIVQLGILYLLALLALGIPLIIIKHQLTHPDTLAASLSLVAAVDRLYSVAMMLILIKPVLLMPALLIVLDCRILETWKMLKHLRLLDAKGLVFLFCLQIAIGLLWPFSRLADAHVTTSDYALTIAAAVAVYFVGFVAAVAAVRFVASRNLVYDSQYHSPVESSNREDIQQD